VLAISATLLAFWISGEPELVKLASWRCKTNTCIGLILGATALLLRTSERRTAIRL
jgi:hypothetical protein